MIIEWRLTVENREATDKPECSTVFLCFFNCLFVSSVCLPLLSLFNIILSCALVIY